MRDSISSSSEALRERRELARSTDTRSLRSQEALRRALLRLVETKPLHSITMRDIAKDANISYPTLFRHFPTREALFEDIARTEILGFQEFVFIVDPALPVWRPGERICSYVMERSVLWRTLLTGGAAEPMRSEFIRHGRDLSGTRPPLGHGVPMDVVSGIVASGIFEIVSWWLGKGASHPAADVARMLDTIVIEPALNLPPGFIAAQVRT